MRVLLIGMAGLAVAAAGCEATAEGTAASEGALASARLDLTSAVGAVEVRGEQVCTAALVNVDARATVGGAPATGRQIVLGSSCLTRMGAGFLGGAVFATQSFRVPILAIENDAAEGLGVGILAEPLPQIAPLEPLADGSADVREATLLRTNRSGVQVGAALALEKDGTAARCADLRWRAKADDRSGTDSPTAEVAGSLAVVNVAGALRFFGSVDGACAARRMRTPPRVPTVAADAVLEAAAETGAGRLLAAYAAVGRVTTTTLFFYQATPELVLTGRGHVGASAAGASCAGARCTLRPRGGFASGTSVDVTIDTDESLPADRDGKARVLVSVTK